MENKRFSISFLYAMNLIVFLSFVLSIYFIESKLNIWYILLIIVCLSGFETMFFYNRAEKSFKPLSKNKIIDIVLKSIGLTITFIGSLIFLFVLINNYLI